MIFYQEGSFNYYTSEELQAHVVELPYQVRKKIGKSWQIRKKIGKIAKLAIHNFNIAKPFQGDHVSMVVILPPFLDDGLQVLILKNFDTQVQSNEYIFP